MSMCNFTTKTLIVKFHTDVLPLVGHNKIVDAHKMLLGSSFGKFLPLNTEMELQ